MRDEFMKREGFFDLFGGYAPVPAIAAGFEVSAAFVLLVGRAQR